MGKRETVKGDGNACRTGRGCKPLSGKGKAVLFTALSTGNGDKVAAGARWRLCQGGAGWKMPRFFRGVAVLHDGCVMAGNGVRWCEMVA